MAPTVADMIHQASFLALSAATNAAHDAGDYRLRDTLCARWNAAIDAHFGRGGLVILSHAA